MNIITGKNILQTKNEVFSITQNYTRCYSNNPTKIVAKNSSFNANIIIQGDGDESQMTVSVTMGGTDITSTAYSNKVITIAAVTGDVVISINCPRLASGYYENGSLVYDWATLKTTYPDAFGIVNNRNAIKGNSNASYFLNLSGKLIIDEEITLTADYAFGGSSCVLTGVYFPDTMYNIQNSFDNYDGSLLSELILPESLVNFGGIHGCIERVVLKCNNLDYAASTIQDRLKNMAALYIVNLTSLPNDLFSIQYIINDINIDVSEIKVVDNGLIYYKKSNDYYICVGVTNNYSFGTILTFHDNCKEIQGASFDWLPTEPSTVQTVDFNNVEIVRYHSMRYLSSNCASGASLNFGENIKLIEEFSIYYYSTTAKWGIINFKGTNCVIENKAFSSKKAATKTINCKANSYGILNYDWSGNNITATINKIL